MQIVQRINWVDVLVVILILRISYVAFQEGLSHEIFPTVGGIIITIISLHYYKKIGFFLSENLLNIPIVISNFLSFLILVIIIGLIFKLLKGILDKVIKVEWHPLIERFGGLAVGIMRASIAASLVLMILALVPLSYLQWSIRDRSLLGMHFLKIGPNIYVKVSKFLPTIKAEEPAITREELVGDLASDKSVAPKVKKEKKRTPEWEQF